MRTAVRTTLALLACLVVPWSARAAADATLFRLFLADGTVFVSYGEYARLEDRVIFSMPIGGSPAEPRLQVVTLPAELVDWTRTDRYAASARAQRYAETRGEHDFQLLTNEVARVLSDLALTTDRPRALAIATEARRTLAGWPRSHFGYREADVRDIIGLLDEAINSLSGSTQGVFELSLVATPPPLDMEPLAEMPSPREQLDQIMRLAAISDRSVDRVALLQAALTRLSEHVPGLLTSDAAGLRRSVERQLQQEVAVDARYAQLSQRLVVAATRAASRARISDVERILDRLSLEDARLGSRRPDTVQALRASIQVQLEAARHLRLLLDRWEIRRSLYREYQRAVGGELAQLVRAQPSLEAVRRLDGPVPAQLLSLKNKLSGGSQRLERMSVPEDLRPAHDLFVSAWRFAERAVATRYDAVASGSLTTAWEASSAAAAALMLTSRAEEGIRELLEPPQLP